MVAVCEVRVSELFYLLVLLCQHRGHRVIKDQVVKLEIDKRWTATMNGHRTVQQNIPPFGAYIEYNGWPAGVIDAHGGAIAAGEAANERALIRAVRKCLPTEMLAEVDKLKPKREKRDPNRQGRLFP